MNKIAAVGPKDAVMAFQALGISVAPVETADETRRAVFRFAEDGYSVIFITENEAEQIGETISRYKDRPYPAIIPIPGASGATGLGMRQVRANVEKAIGANILLKEEG